MIKKKIFGLDISDGSIEALVLAKSFFGKPRIAAYARTVLRGEVVKNGVIKNQQKLEDSISKLLASAKPRAIKTPYCVLSLPESQVFTTVFKLPAGLKRKEIKSSIPFKAEEVIPFKTDEVYFDFKILSKIGDTAEVLYVAVPAKIIDGYLAMLNHVGLQPVAFDLESVSLTRSLIRSGLAEASATLLMDIGSRTTNLNIYDRGGIRQTVTINVAGNRFTKAIATKLGLPPKQAEALKRQNGFDSKKQQGKVLLVLQNEFKRIVAETKKLMEFYHADTDRQVGRVILVGGSALLPAIDQYLADNLGVEVTLGNPLANVTDPKKVTKVKINSILFSNVAGLALRGVTKDPIGSDINLLPVPPSGFRVAPKRTDKKIWRSIYMQLAALVLLLLTFGVVYKLKLDNVDLYQQVYPTPTYTTNYGDDLDFAVLDELRLMLNASSTATTTATTTAGLLPEVPAFANFSIKIKPTTLGYLNIRSTPSTAGSKVGQAKSGATYTVIGQQTTWYQIDLGNNTSGWISSVYVDKLK